MSKLNVTINGKTMSVRDLLLVVTMIISITTSSLVATGVISPQQKEQIDTQTQEILDQVGDLSDQIGNLTNQLEITQAALNESQAQLANVTDYLDQKVGSTLSATRKTASFVVSFATNTGTPAYTLVLQSGVNGSMVTLGSSATNYTYVAEKAIDLAAVINGSIYFCEGNYGYKSMIIPDIPLGVSVTIDSGAYGYTLSEVYGTLTDYSGSVFYVDGHTDQAPYSYLIYTKTVSGTPTYYAKAANGSVIDKWSSTDCAVPLQNALNAGSTVNVLNGTYSAVVSLGATNHLNLDRNATGIRYSAIANGAIVTGGDFASTFGGYSQGSYTIAYNGTNVQTANPVFMAFNKANQIYYFGTDLTIVIQSCHTALTNGGEIYLGRTQGNITTPLLITNKYTTIRGEIEGGADVNTFSSARGAVLFLADGVSKNMINVNVGNGGFFKMEKVSLVGNSAGQTAGSSCGVNITGTSTDITIRDCWVDGFAGSGIVGNLTGEGWTFFIENCPVEHNKWHGIYITGSGIMRNVYISHDYIHNNGLDGIKVDNPNARDIHIIGNDIRSNDNNGIQWAYAKDSEIMGNSFIDNKASYVGLRIAGGAGASLVGNLTVTSNIFGREGVSGTNGQDYGLYLYNIYIDNCTFANNIFNGNRLGAVNIGAAGVNSNGTFVNNIGFNTHTWGSATITSSTTVTVTHNLAGTPTNVMVTMGTTGAGDYFVTNVGATTFDVTVASSGTYTVYWQADYKP